MLVFAMGVISRPCQPVGTEKVEHTVGNSTLPACVVPLAEPQAAIF